ncbi:MAG: tyrosine-type recombinase/integrase [Rhizobiaceae bacterium]|nr:tyrosine-type recombinase/integrase [Rhizobiaceae bacterium]
MSRSYRSARPKANRVYSVEDVLHHYGICRNTLSNWTKSGLRPVDGTRPQLFRGTELKWFHAQRSIERTKSLRMGEFKCFACKSCVFPEVSTLCIDVPIRRSYWAHATCPECHGMLQKILGETECDKLLTCVESNASLGSIDEGTGAFPVGVGTNSAQTCPSWTPANERVIFDYQVYAGRFDPKTLDAHLAVIRDFETFHDGKLLSAITPADASRYRESLIIASQFGMSRSTVRHRASFLAAFFDWLVQQDGYRRMKKTIGGYFKLPKALAAKALQPAPRNIPTTDEALKILSGMPARSLTQQRDQAIVAASFLFGTRANATASLRLGHIDVKAKKVRQDATVVRVKNGKSQTTFWFPIDERFAHIVIAWIDELSKLGCRSQDALFPPNAALGRIRDLSKTDREPILPWQTDSAVRRAFRNGCKSAALQYFNPHSVRHYLKSIRDEYCRTAEERKAWSHNMGHENEQVTEDNYAKMTDSRRDEIFSTLSPGSRETEAEKDLLLDFHEHQLVRGTPEFELAKQLDDERRKRREKGEC